MKHMQNFRDWLSVANAVPTSLQNHLTALTRLDRVQLSSAAGGLGWFQWDAPQSSAA